MFRIHSKIDLFNVTGRMNFNEPCLQNIPKDFDLEITNDQSTNIKLNDAEINEEEAHYFLNKLEEDQKISENNVSIRCLFVPSENCLFISADYCQLELRIITNLCKDDALINIFNNTEHDVFVMLASKWLNLPCEEIDEEKRQNVKKVKFFKILEYVEIFKNYN